jgi:fructokinase
MFGGVETGGTWCVCALGDGAGEIAEREQFRTGTPEETIDRIVAWFDARGTPEAVGIGSFGPVDLDPDSPTWGHVTTTPKPGWQGVSLAPVIAERLEVPVHFETDVSTAALGEYHWGAGRGAANLCYLTIGTGVGAGLLIDGRPVHGLVHPEVGHIRVPHDTDRDPYGGNCPRHGDCWEGLSCGPALAERWAADPAEMPDDHPAWALEADYIAYGILAIVLAISPHRVIVGGGVMDRPVMLPLVRTRLAELDGGYLGTPMLGEEIDRYVVAPELGDDAGVLGALALAREGA